MPSLCAAVIEIIGRVHWFGFQMSHHEALILHISQRARWPRPRRTVQGGAALGVLDAPDDDVGVQRAAREVLRATMHDGG